MVIFHVVGLAVVQMNLARSILLADVEQEELESD